MTELQEIIERETGHRFKKGMCCCPFHNDKTASLSVKFNADTGKEVFKCFACNEYGDKIDFISKYRNVSFIEACEYLGLKVDKKKQAIKEKLNAAIQKKIKNTGEIVAGVFEFYDENNILRYWKVKLKDPVTNKKNLTYFSLDEFENVINKRGLDYELAYNYNKVFNSKDSDRIIILEGEKDVNTITNMRIAGLIACSLKNVKDFNFLYEKNIIVCGDTGLAGEKYVEKIKKELFKRSKSFKILKPIGLESLGDNKDITDLVEQKGFTREDMIMTIQRALDLCSQYELQQNKFGIYKTILKEEEGVVIEAKKKYIADFQIKEVEKIVFADDETEGINVKFIDSFGNLIERTGDIKSFDDVKTFKAFLNSLNLTFLGKTDDLNQLKIWINKYFISDIKIIYAGTKTIEHDNKLMYVSPNGSLSKDGIYKNVLSDDFLGDNILEIDKITKEEFEELIERLLTFSSEEKVYTILGMTISDLFVYHATEIGNKLSHLLIVGESGSGKSTILENVIGKLLNITDTEIKSVGLITKFALIKTLSTGNRPALFDEFKPSRMDKHSVANISENLRNLYDRTSISRGNKSLRVTEFKLTRPAIIAGEESYPSAEKALIERSNIVYLSPNERTKKHTESMNWLRENSVLIQKLGRSLIDIMLNTSVDDYRNELKNIENEITLLENRPLNTAKNCVYGIYVLNKVANSLGSRKVITEPYMPIIGNIIGEILGDEGQTESIVEQMIIKFNDLLVDNRLKRPETIIFSNRVDEIYMRTEELIAQLREYVKTTDSDFIPITIKDFKKQAKKAGYIIGSKAKRINGMSTRLDSYNFEMLKGLKIDSMLFDDLDENELTIVEEVSTDNGNKSKFKSYKGGRY